MKKKLDTPLAASSQFSTPTHFTYLIPSNVSPPLSGKKPPLPSSVLPAATAKESLGMLLLRRRLRHPHRRGQCQIQRRCRIYARAPVAASASVRPAAEEGEEQEQWRRSRQRRRRERSSARGADGGVAGDVWRAITQRSRAAAGRQRGDTGGLCWLPCFSLLLVDLLMCRWLVCAHQC